jgi:hypothetical protein
MESAPHSCSRVCRRHWCAFPRHSRHAASFARPAPESVPLFYVDQNQSGSTPYEVTGAQAVAMRNAGRGRFINRGKAFQLCEMAPLRQQFFCSMSTESTASISPSEMEANVGITPNNGSPNEPALRHIVIRAQQKVHAIGRRLVGSVDSKAPLAFGAPSWAG